MIGFATLAGVNKGIGGGGYGPVVTLGGIMSGVPVKSMMAVTALTEGIVSTAAIAVWLLVSAAGVTIDFVLLPSMMLATMIAAVAAPYFTRVFPERLWRFVVPTYALLVAGADLLGGRPRSAGEARTMITRDLLAEAVTQINRTDPELGRALVPMLADGRLVPAGVAHRGGESAEAAFVLDGERVEVRRHQFIHQGLPALVEKLVLAAAQQEAMRQQAQAEFGWQRDRLRREARRVALNRLLDFRLDEETTHYQAILAKEPLDRHASAGLTLLEDLHGEFPGDVLPWNPAHGSVFFKGVVEVDTSALFVQLPMTRDALLQIADRDLEFFNLHHVLEVVRRGEHRRLFACVVHGRLAGMMEVGVTAATASRISRSAIWPRPRAVPTARRPAASGRTAARAP